MFKNQHENIIYQYEQRQIRTTRNSLGIDQNRNKHISLLSYGQNSLSAQMDMFNRLFRVQWPEKAAVISIPCFPSPIASI